MDQGGEIGSFRIRASETESVMVVRSNFCRVGEDVVVSDFWGSEGVGMEIVGSEGVYVGDG